MPSSPKIIAHRGASAHAPENTLAAIERAWELGADGVEIDVHLSADSAVVVIHDDTTHRTGNLDRPVAEQTLEQLRRLDVGDGQNIPTLGEAIAAVPKGKKLFVEIKTGAASVPVIAEAIEASDRIEQVAIEAFDPQVVRAVRGRLPDTEALLVVGSKRQGINYVPIDVRVVQLATDVGATGVAFDWRGATPELIDAIHAAGLTSCVWTVDAPTVGARFSGVGWLETNYPDRFSPAP